MLLTLVISAFFIQTNQAVDFYGHSVTFFPPQRRTDGSIALSLVSRENGRSSCSSQVSYSCKSDECGSFDVGAAQETDADDTGQKRWCQIEQQSTTEIAADVKSATLSATGCCWLSNKEDVKDWSSAVHMDLATRSDTYSINHCPISATVASQRVPQNCFTSIHLLAHDPDGDEVKCRLTSSASPNIVLDENKCSLSATGTLSVGVHVFEVQLEDYPIRNINVSYPDGTVELIDVSKVDLGPLCTVKMLFSLEVLAPLPSCELGHVQPMFLSKTPSQDSLLYASVGQPLIITAEAQAHHNRIYDFQISGPRSMTKVFRDGTSGKAEVTLSWTPQSEDLYRHVPVCFTAETAETQSAMRCVVIVVTKATITKGNAAVVCQSNKMAVTLEKASMPGIDENYLMLLDKSCSLTSNGTHIMGTMSFSACGTRIEDKGDYIVFSNEIDSFELPTEVITRRKKVKIGFSCRFPKFISISSYFNVHQDDYIFTESTFGSFGYSFEIYKDGNFTKKVTANEYPVQVKLFQMIYMSIQGKSDLQEVSLFVESCKATPDDNPDNSLSYDLIKDGCLKDETVVVKKSQDTTFNFEVQAFKFSGNYDQVYITCSVILCEKDNQFSRCSQGCVDNANQARRRRRRGLSKETVDHRITQGPFRFVGETLSSDQDKDTDDKSFDSENGTELESTTKQDLKTTTPASVMDLDRVLNILSPETTAYPTSPILIIDEYHEDDDFLYSRLRALLRSKVITAIFATAFFISVIILVILVCHFTRKRRAEDLKMLLDSDDN